MNILMIDSNNKKIPFDKRNISINDNYILVLDSKYEDDRNVAAMDYENYIDLHYLYRTIIDDIRSKAYNGLKVYHIDVNLGYLLIGSKSIIQESIVSTIEKTKFIKAWRTILVTPYPLSIDRRIAENRSINDFEYSYYIDGEIGILEKIGIDNYFLDTMKDNYLIYSSEYESDRNIVYRFFIQANKKTGFWELVLYHTQKIKIK